MHRDVQRELDRFKAEEMARMDRKIEDSRDGMRREMEFLYTRNIQVLNVRKEHLNNPFTSFLIVFITFIWFSRCLLFILFFLTISTVFSFTGSKSESDSQA